MSESDNCEEIDWTKTHQIFCPNFLKHEEVVKTPIEIFLENLK
jgi:hypothetical protein